MQRQEGQKIDLTQLKEVTDKRNKWMIDEIHRVRAMNDHEFAMYALSTMGRKDMWHFLKKHIKLKSLEVS